MKPLILFSSDLNFSGKLKGSDASGALQKDSSFTALMTRVLNSRDTDKDRSILVQKESGFAKV
jgi:hypothetical protein